MSVQVFTDVGERRILTCLRDGAANSFACKLFTNSFTPTQATVLGDLTEATTGNFPGYAAVQVSWNAPSIVSNKGSMSGGACVFQRSSTGTALTIQGYYLVESGNGRAAELISVQKFDTGQVVQNLGDTITINPLITLNSEN